MVKMVKHQQQGFSMYELVFVIIIIMVLYAVAYTKLAEMTASVEKADFVRTLNRMQAQLTLKVAEWYAEGKRVNRQEITTINPLELISVGPENYQGELESDEADNCKQSHWCYLTDTKNLVYRVKYTEELTNKHQQKELLVYKLDVTFLGGAGNVGQPTALTLKPAYPFTWQKVAFK